MDTILKKIKNFSDKRIPAANAAGITITILFSQPPLGVSGFDLLDTFSQPDQFLRIRLDRQVE